VHHLSVALIIFACVFASALLGLYGRALLPAHHLSDESTDVVKLATSLIATMAALVLGLLITSAKSSFDTLSTAVRRDAANIILLDRTLAQYGPETQEIRRLLKEDVAIGIQKVTSSDPSRMGSLQRPEAYQRGETIERLLENLSPRSDAQRLIQSRAISMAEDVLAVRELGLLEAANGTPLPLLITLVMWLCIIFTAFGSFTAPNATVVAALFLGALSTSVAIFLILEMNTPLDGLITVSVNPMRVALAVLGQ
jgi:hypothetical protein